MLFTDFRKLFNKVNSKTGLLHNTYLLYVIFFLSIANLFIMVSSRDYQSCIIFILTGILTSFFSKNMIVIMSIAMIVAYVLKNKVSINESFDVVGDTPADSGYDDYNANDNVDAGNDGDNTYSHDDIMSFYNTDNNVEDENAKGVEQDGNNNSYTNEYDVRGNYDISNENSMESGKSENNKVNSLEDSDLEQQSTLTPNPIEGTTDTGKTKKIKQDLEDVLDNQNKLLTKLNEYEPFINTIQNIANKFSF